MSSTGGTMRITCLVFSFRSKKALLISTTLLLIACFVFFRRLKRINFLPIIQRTEASRFLAPVFFPHDDNVPLCPLVSNSKSELFNETTSAMRYNSSGLVSGGRWRPSHCTSQHQITIVVPYRNRENHLSVFLSRMHGFLQAQLLNYQIYVIEQSRRLPFNRGLLCNIGYTEVLKRNPTPCFIFHDVDLLPESLENMYACTIEPRHMSSSISTFGYEMPYDNFFGGVVSFLQFQFQAINGFSNRYFGWGAEDDDLFLRTENRGLNIFRYDSHISRYFMLSHEKETLAPDNLVLLEEALYNQDYDGLNSVKETYDVLKVELKPLYTHIKVDLRFPDK